MNEPTEREKQIATDEMNKLRRLGLPMMLMHDAYEGILAAITAASQQRNEDTTRLLEEIVYRLEHFPVRENIDKATALARQLLDAARGVQPDAIPPHDIHDCRWIECPQHKHQPAAKECAYKDCGLIEGHSHVAAQQESAPAAEQDGATDTERVNYLRDLWQHCPHAQLIFNDDPDADDPVGWTIRVEGCEVSEVTAPTFRECIDKEIAAAGEGEWPKRETKRIELLGYIPSDPALNDPCPAQHILHRNSAGNNPTPVYALRNAAPSPAQEKPVEASVEEIARKATREYLGTYHSSHEEERLELYKIIREAITRALATASPSGRASCARTSGDAPTIADLAGQAWSPSKCR